MTTPFPAFPTLPAPITWSALSQIKAPQLREDVSDAVQLLTYRPFFIGQMNGIAGTVARTGAVTPWPLLDTELADPWNGHISGTFGNPNNPRYYSQLAGWYLCHNTTPIGVGTTTIQYATAGIQRVTGGGGTNNFSGQLVPGSATLPRAPTMTKLVLQSSIGPYGTGDWIAPTVQMVSASDTPYSQTTTSAPTFSCQWVCAVSGTEPLIVPTNDNFAVPPQLVTSAFMNKNVRDTINFLIYPPIMEWSYNNATNTLVSNTNIPATGVTIGLDTQAVDNYSAFNNGTNTWVAPVAGVYLCYGELVLTADANTQAMAVGFTISSSFYNGGATFTWWGEAMLTPVPAGGFTTIAALSRRRVRLNAGDTIQLAGWQRNSGAAAYTILGTGNWVTKLGIVWQGF